MRVSLVPRPARVKATAASTDQDEDDDDDDAKSRQAARAALEPRFEEILRLVQVAVERYLADRKLTSDTADQGFPARAEMSGDYYLGSVDYGAGYDGHGRVSVMVHCLDVRSQDYLGLDVSLYVDSQGDLQLAAIESSCI